MLVNGTDGLLEGCLLSSLSYIYQCLRGGRLGISWGFEEESN